MELEIGAELLEKPAASPKLWSLDRTIAFLNHGSFGACPEPVLAHQDEIRRGMEREPITFFVRDLEALLDNARAELARFVGAPARDLVYVTNATYGVNTVLRSLAFRPGDEVLVTNHEYNACRNALNYAASRAGAKITVAEVPFPIRSEQAAADAILERLTKRTRLVLFDHVTSQTGMVLPTGKIIAELNKRGVESLVDGAHAPGMIPLNLQKLQPTYYTGNCHKWLCSPKTAAFLYVRPDRQKDIRPLVISHGANSPRTDRSRFLIEFGWMGTSDPSPVLCVPEALRFMEALVGGGWQAIMQRNRALALAARKMLCQELEIEAPCPDSMMGSLASLPLPDAKKVTPSKSPLYLDPLQEKLLANHQIEVPIIPWPRPPKRILRISAQLYNSLPQYRRLAKALKELL
jgi:isopenicillin-N epimerase